MDRYTAGMPALTLKNPHSVLAALRTRPQDVLEVRSAQRSPSGAWQLVVETATAARVPVRVLPAEVPPPRRRDDSGGRSGATEALVRERVPCDLGELFAGGRDGRGLWLALDHVQDPHNLGAIFRTAAFFGVRGIVLTKHQSAPLTAAAYDVAAGGVEHVAFAVESNLRRSLEAAKEAGLWVLGTSEHAPQSVWEVDRDRAWLVVMGNEESGMRRLTTENCDELCGISAAGRVGSLNVSVASGVVLAALSRE
jgi:23S rRNA (guanosine2251-2'-O)-methyltransferase